MLVISGILAAQTWEQNLPQDKLENGELKFQEIQKAFNDYWAPYNVENGYYYVNGEKIKAPGWKQFKRWEWKAEYFIDGEGNFPETSTVEEMEKYYKANPDEGKSLSGNWTNIGYNTTNGGYQGIGRVNCVAFHPSNSSTFWIGAPSGGLWKTTDGGTTWTVQTDALSVMGVSAIAVHPSYNGTTNRTLYIGTGDRDGNSTWTMGSGLSHDSEGIGVLKSTDGGTTWNTTALSFTQSAKVVVNDLLIHPTNNSTIYAATSNGLYKTTNGGTTWPMINTGNFIDIEFKPGSPLTMYGARKIYSGEGSIWKSTDGGSNWSSVSLPGSSSRRTELAVSAANPLIVYAITVQSNSGLEGIYKSTNSGGSFTQVFNGSTAGNNLLGYYCNGAWATGYEGQGPYDLVLTANPSNANEVYAGGINIWKTTDGGSNWSIASSWSGTCGSTVTEVHADQHCCEFNGSTVFFGNDGGIYKSTNAGVSWSDISNGLTINQIYRIGVSQNTSNEAIIGLQDNGTHHLNGGAWVSNAVIGGDGMECLIDPTDDNIQFGEYVRGDIRRTSNKWAGQSNVRNLIRAATGATGSEDGAWVTPFILDPNNRLNLFVGYDELWKSTDQGATSTNFSKLTVSSFSGSGDIKSIQIAPSNSNYIYVSYDSYWISTTFYPSSLHRSTDGGSTWTNITGSLPVSSGEITYICVKNNDNNTVWVTLGGFNSHAVYQTTNAGTGNPPTWTNISTGLPQIPAMSIVQNIQNTSAVELYVSTSAGVWMKNGTSSWASFNSGLPALFCSELDIYYDNTTPSNSKIRVGTFGRGLWEADLPAVDFSANNTMPANAMTTVLFSDLSTNSPGGWLWTFNPATVTYVGGTSATSQNPSVQFNNPGAYTVTLTTTNTYGNNTHTKTTYIHMGTPGLWTGTTSTDWNTGTNWHNHIVPTSSIGVAINPGPTIWPTYTGNFNVGTQCGALSMSGNSEFTVIGDLTIPSGTQFYCNNNSIINVDGDFVNYGTFTPGTSVVKMNGTSNSSLTANITNNGSQTTTYTGSNWSYQGGYFDVVASGGKTISVNSFDIHCSSSGTVNVEVWYKSGTYVGFTSNPGVWTQLGTTQTITGAGWNNPTIVNPGASITIPSGTTYGFFINCSGGTPGYMRFNTGSFNYSNSDITINTGDMAWTTPPGSGSWNGYTFNGTVYYSYTLQNSIPFYDLEINKSNASVTTNGDLNINNDFTIKPDAWFTNAPGNTINVTGNTVFEADASGMASFIDNGNFMTMGNTTVELYLTEMKWHYFSPPISDAQLGVFHLPGGHSDIFVKYWDEPNEQWVKISNVNLPLNINQGYAAWVDNNVVQDETIEFTGTLNNNVTTSYALTHTTGNTDIGWNHVGNPYPSALDWQATSGWTKSNMDNTIYYWNPSSGSGNYSYYVGGGTAPWTGGTSVNNGTQYIPSMQGFIVHCNNAAGGSIKMENDARVHNSLAFYKSENKNPDFLRLKAIGNGYWDETIIRFSEFASNNFDSDFDAYKLFGLDEAPQLYSIMQDEKLAVNSLTELEDYRTVNLGFECNIPAIYTIEASEIESFEDGMEIYLEDINTGNTHNLSLNPIYDFAHEPGNNPNRFIVHFGKPNSINDITQSPFNIYSFENIIYINSSENLQSDIIIYNILGQEVYREKLNGIGLVKIEITSGTGYYMVKVLNDKYFFTKKVFVR